MKTVKKALLVKIWQECLPRLKQALGETIFETWISPLVPQAEKSQQAQGLILEAPDPFFKDWVLKNYLPVIQDILKARLIKEQAALKVEIVARDESVNQGVVIQDLPSHRLERPKESFILNPRFTFENHRHGLIIHYLSTAG